MTPLVPMLPSGSVEMTTNSSVEMTTGDLGQANRRISQTLIPCMVVLGIFMLTGLVGNALTCYVFGWRLRRNTQHFFILMLAAFDLLSCSLGMPAEIADMALHFKFDSEPVCKMMRFVNTFTAQCSIVTLMAIAIDRFRRLHRPHQVQISARNARWSLLPIVLISLLFSWPAPLIYGIRTVDTEIPGLKGKDCTIGDSVRDTVYPLIYNAVLFVTFIVLATALIVLYARILKGLAEHSQRRKKVAQRGHPVSSEHSGSTETEHNTKERRRVSPLQTGHLLDKTTTQCDGGSRKPQADEVKGHEREQDRAHSDTFPSAGGSQAFTPGHGTYIENENGHIQLAAERDQSGSLMASLPVDSHVDKATISGADRSVTIAIKGQVTHSEHRADTRDQGSHSDHHDVRALDDHQTARTETDHPKLVRTGKMDTQTDGGNSQRSDMSSVLQDDQHGQSHYERQLPNTPLVLARDLSSSDGPMIALNPIFDKSCSGHPDLRPSTQNNESLKPSKSIIKPSLSHAQDEGSLSKSKSTTKRPQARKSITKKTTVIVFVVTIVFILSFVPHLGLQITHLVVKGFDEDLEGAGLVFYNLFLRSYFINNVANPIIYGVMNEQFRRELGTLCKRLSCRG